MSVTERLLENNARFAASFGKERPGAPHSPGIAIVTCMDARIDVYRILGLEEGEAHVIRNAGGVVTEDAIRSLVVSQRLLGTSEIIIIHHTACGMLTFSDDDVRAKIAAEVGEKPLFSLQPFSDLGTDVREGLRRIHGSPFIPRKEHVRGFIYDIQSGSLDEVTL